MTCFTVFLIISLFGLVLEIEYICAKIQEKSHMQMVDWFLLFRLLPASGAQSDVHPTFNQEVEGSIPAGSSNTLLWRLIMKYFLQSFSPFC